jgi:hypothetical protein
LADHLEVRYERLYVKVPGSEKLRSTAAGRLKRALAEGWREVERSQETDYVRVRLERTGHKPPMKKLPKPVPQMPRGRRDDGGRGGRGGRGQGPGQRPGGPGAGGERPAPAKV